MKRKKPRPRNPVAHAVTRIPLKRIESKKKYTRKTKHKNQFDSCAFILCGV